VDRAVERRAEEPVERFAMRIGDEPLERFARALIPDVEQCGIGHVRQIVAHRGEATKGDP